jgi:CheY-like chemotaxis protein
MTSTMEAGQFHILLAEDNPSDAELVRRALNVHDVPCTLHIVSDGAQAREFIAGLDDESHSLKLDICLIDMYLPKGGGEDILECLRSTGHCAQTPVIVMSGTRAPHIEEAAAKYAALVFFQKPSTLDEYLQLGSIVKKLLRETKGAA